MIPRRESPLEKSAAASMGLGARFLFPQMALRSYLPVEVGLGALLVGEETTEVELELEGMGVGLVDESTESEGEGPGISLELGLRLDST